MKAPAAPSETNPLEALMPRIKGAAHNIARRRRSSDNPDDVEQEIVLAILERYTQEPEFLDQTAAYIVQYGAWRACGYVKRSDRIEDYDVYADDFVALSISKTVCDPWEQVDLRLDLQQAIASLDETDQRIVTGLSAGYTPREIGPSLGISYRTVYNRMHQMAGAMAL